MSRARNIKPGFFTNGDLLECQPLARLLFAGLWCEADRRGILEDRPKTIKVKILPADNCEIEVLLTELSDRGFIRRYQVRECRCILIPNFDKHQNPHIKEQENDLPNPDESGASTVQAQCLTGTSHASSFNPSSLIPDSLSLDPPIASTVVLERAKPKPQNRNHRIPDDWTPSPGVLRVAQELHMDLPAMQAELDKFASHFRANGKVMADWNQAAMNWLRRSLDFARPPNGNANGRPKGPDFAARALERRRLEQETEL